MRLVLLSNVHILVLSLFFPTIAQNATTTSCCAMTASRLNATAAEKPDCPASFSELLGTKCQSCPRGTCRLNDRCMCPDFFASSPGRQSLCSDSFGVNWPSSIAREDRDYRSCDPNVTPPPANATSCCAMSEPQLQALRGFHPECPSSSHNFDLAKKCGPCPPGLCRFDDECICPDGFLDRTTLHSDCAVSFTTSWPLSVGKEDRATRSCRGVPAAASTRLSCCSLTEEKLNAMIGTSDRCPSTSTVRLSDECGICPSGMCRFGTSCFCPTRFLTSSVKNSCERTFGVAWPESIGKPDPEIAGCSSESKAPPTTSKPATSEPATSGQSSDPSIEQGDSSNSEPEVPNSSGSSESSAGLDAPGVSNSEQPLTTLEIVGIVAGVVSAIVTVIVAGVGLTRRRRKRHDEEPTFDDLLT